MSRFIDLTGKRFGRLTVVGRAENRGDEITWDCVCDCGNHTTIRGVHLRSGHTQSCGCFHHERQVTSHTKHNASRHPLYRVWRGIKDRVHIPSNKKYHNYGGRGITVCEEWDNDFSSFYKWALSNGYKKGLEIDRIDVNGNYEPSNCRWVKHIVNSNNRRNNIRIEHDGETHTIAEWSRITGIKYSTLYMRVARNNSEEEIFCKGSLSNA